MQHVTVKYALNGNNIYRVTFNKQLGISDFDWISCVIPK